MMVADVNNEQPIRLLGLGQVDSIVVDENDILARYMTHTCWQCFMYFFNTCECH